MNVLDPILFQRRMNPDALAICIPGVELVTYDRLITAINSVARHALAAGLRPGHKVALYIPQRLSFHAAILLGLARIGVVTASIASPNLANALRFDAVLTDGHLPFPGVPVIHVDTSWAVGDEDPPAFDHVPQGDDLCRITLTSGTTGEPKGVALTHKMMLGRLTRYYTAFGNKIPASSRIFCDTSLATSIGNMFLFYTLCKGGAFFARGNNIENTLYALQTHRVEGMVAAPTGLAEFIGFYDQYGCTHAFNVIMTIGSQLSPALAKNARARMGSALISSYGSTEVGIVASAPAEAIAPLQGGVGYVAPGMSVEIVDEQDRPCVSDKEGIVRISGDYAADSYLGTDAGPFRNGWFYPGDTGSLTADRMLIISGRQKSVLNVGGEKVKPELIEDTLAKDGITAGAFVVVNTLGVEEVWMAVESASPLDEERLRVQCQKSLPTVFMPRRFIAIQKLPRNDMGKLDRKRLAEMGRAG